MENHNLNSYEGYMNSSEERAARAQTVMSRTFLYMFGVLILSAASAYFTMASGLYFTIFSNNMYFYGLLIGEILLVIGADVVMRKNLAIPSTLLLIAYSIVNGITISSIFILYDLSSVFTIFLMAAALFGVMAVFGLVTKKDLTSLGTVGMMGLIGIIILGIVNIVLLKSDALTTAIAAVGLALFIGLTAYDTQKIKEMARQNEAASLNTLAMYGALILYLDFVNIFLKMLRLFGKER